MTVINFDDEYFMRQALIEAAKAKEENEIPIGCVIVSNNKIIARGHNMSEMLNDCTSHAEMIAITAAEEFTNSKYLRDCKLYVTVEPCLMCAGAIMWSQIAEIIYGTRDLKRGYSVFCNPFAKKIKIKGGILEQECRQLMQDFFKDKR